MRHTVITLEIAAYVVPVSAVPFCPAVPGRECTDLIESVCVPRFCDQFDVAEDRVKSKRLEKRGITHWSAVFITSEDGGKVKTKTINPVSIYPIAQAVQDHLTYDRMVAVQGISASAEIIIVSVGCQKVVNIIIKTFEREKRTVFISFCRMVEYDVQIYFNSVLVKDLYQGL